MASASQKVVLQGGVEAGSSSAQQQNPTAQTYPVPHPNQPISYPHPGTYQHTTHTTQYPYPLGVGPQQPAEPAPNFQPDQVTVIPFHASPSDLNKSTTLAVILCVPILGMLGLHHFYLNRPYFGYIYAFTLGLFCLGWLIDWFRIKSLVKKCNAETREAQIRGYQISSHKFPVSNLTKISLCDAYMLWLPPVGLLGFYQYYLGRPRYGVYHTLTLGRCCLGWLLDFCRLPSMVRKANAEIAMMKKGVRVPDRPYSVCDAYTLALPLGLFGLHHFYLGNTKRGFLFLCTVGVFGLGWLADMFQMPMIVSEANKNRELKQRLTTALAHNETCGGHTTTVVVMSSNQGYTAGPGDPQAMVAGAGVTHEPPPAYKAQAGDGESVMVGAADPHTPSSVAGHSAAPVSEKIEFIN